MVLATPSFPFWRPTSEWWLGPRVLRKSHYAVCSLISLTLYSSYYPLRMHMLYICYSDLNMYYMQPCSHLHVPWPCLLCVWQWPWALCLMLWFLQHRCRAGQGEKEKCLIDDVISWLINRFIHLVPFTTRLIQSMTPGAAMPLFMTWVMRELFTLSQTPAWVL